MCSRAVDAQSPYNLYVRGGGGEAERVCRWYFRVWIGGLVGPPPRWVGAEEGGFKDTAICVCVKGGGGWQPFSKAAPLPRSAVRSMGWALARAVGGPELVCRAQGEALS